MNIRREIQLTQMHLEEAYNHFGAIVQEWETQVEQEAQALQAKAQPAMPTEQPEQAMADYEEKRDFLKWKTTQRQAQQAKPLPEKAQFLGQIKARLAPRQQAQQAAEEIPLEEREDLQELTEEEYKELERKQKRVF